MRWDIALKSNQKTTKDNISWFRLKEFLKQNLIDIDTKTDSNIKGFEKLKSIYNLFDRITIETKRGSI
ncbi:hypothetical protein HYD89_02310 [Mycoplasmopsis bovis]|nr:hypothetical protein [Mycoplasmopsis bovis]QQH36184.1 hypothetical protein HYD89_02310 [Mycoplasmopsis bovis]